MASVFSVNLIYEKDKFKQKCIIPINFLSNKNLDFNEYVVVQTSEKKYICQVNISKLTQTCIFVDDIVASNIRSNESFRSCESANHITSVKPFHFDCVKIKIIFEEDILVEPDKILLENVIFKIISSYVISKDYIVNCSGLKLADSYHICSILICETFPKLHEFGKLNSKSKVEIIDIVSKAQMCQIEEFQHLNLGGISDMLNVFQLNHLQSPILVTGPSGCGKSSFVKKLCLDINCYFKIVDGLKITDLTSDKCNIIKRNFSKYLNFFPNNRCLLFIDHIDAIVSYNLKQKSLAHVSLLVNIINTLRNMNVLIIAAAVQKNNIDPRILTLFTNEINLGVPSLEQRKEIVKSCTESLASNVDCDRIALMTPGFVAHDISLLISEAKNIKKKMEQTETSELTMEHIEKALCNISPSILKSSVWNMKVKPIYWKDIGGMGEIKKKLQMCIEWPLKNPDVFKKVDLPCPHGVLLFGPPGCCKTTLARGLATECNANFFAANPAQVYSPYVGESEKNITELFYQARLCAPSIIFFDELDSLVSQRKLDKKSQGVGEKVLSALLNEMDGFGTKMQIQNALNTRNILKKNEAQLNDHDDDMECQSNDVIVIAATNRPDLIDDALLRPGRFDVILYVPPPNKEERESILDTLMKDVEVKNVDFRNISEKTHLFSGADLKNLCNEAGMNALRSNLSSSYITEQNFNDALKRIHPSITRQQIEMYEKLSCKFGTVIK